jgi:hypothetical protein
MKRLYFLICLTLCVLCITAAKKTPALSKTQQLEKSLLASATLLKGINVFVPEEKKKYIAIGSDLLADASYVVAKTDKLIIELKRIRSVAQRINTQGQCFIGKKKGAACQSVDCLKQRQCAEQILISVNKLLMPVIQNVLGVVESTKTSDGKTKKSIRPGLVIGLANSSVVPQSYRVSWNQILGDFTIKLSDGIEFLPKLGAIINVPPKARNEPKEYQNFREDPIVFETEDVFELD